MTEIRKEPYPIEGQMGADVLIKYKELATQKIMSDEYLLKALANSEKDPFQHPLKTSGSKLIGTHIFPFKYTPEAPQDKQHSYITMDMQISREMDAHTNVVFFTFYIFSHKDIGLMKDEYGRVVSRMDYLTSRLYFLFKGSTDFGTSPMIFFETKPLFVQQNIPGMSMTFMIRDFAEYRDGRKEQ